MDNRKQMSYIYRGKRTELILSELQYNSRKIKESAIRAVEPHLHIAFVRTNKLEDGFMTQLAYVPTTSFRCAVLRIQ